MRRYDQPFSREWRQKLLFIVIFRIFQNWNCHFCSGLWKAESDVVSMFILQSYCCCTFCMRKTGGKTQYWIQLVAPCTLANYNEIHCNYTSSFLTFLTLVSCDGSNRLWRLLTFVAIAIFPMSSKSNSIRRYLAASRRKMPNASPSHWTISFFIDITVFTSYFAFGFFVYCFVQTEWPYRTKTAFILIAL